MSDEIQGCIDKVNKQKSVVDKHYAAYVNAKANMREAKKELENAIKEATGVQSRSRAPVTTENTSTSP